MRRNQVSATISLERFGDQAPQGATRQQITAYADANDPWEALAALFLQLAGEIQKDQRLPEFGRADAHSRNIVYGPRPYARPGDGPEDEARLREWVIHNKAVESLTRPTFISEALSWGVYARGQLHLGRPLYVANQYLGQPLRYRFEGYLKGRFSPKAVAYDLNDVIDSVLSAPDKTSIQPYLEDYSPREAAMINELIAKLTAPAG